VPRIQGRERSGRRPRERAVPTHHGKRTSARAGRKRVIQTRHCNRSGADARRKRTVLWCSPGARRNAVTAHSGRNPDGFRPPFAAPKGQPMRLARFQDRNAARVVHRFTLEAQPMQLPRFQSRERSRGCAGCCSPRAALQKRNQQFVMFRRRRWHARDRALRTRNHRMAGHAVRRPGHAPAIRRSGPDTVRRRGPR